MSFLHRVAHWLRLNACEPYMEFSKSHLRANGKCLDAFGYRCVGCGRVTIVHRFKQ